jgi:hypothetical protein
VAPPGSALRGLLRPQTIQGDGTMLTVKPDSTKDCSV